MVSVIRIHGNWGIDMVNKLKSHTPPFEKLLIWQDNYQGFDNWSNEVIGFWDVKKIYESGNLERIILTPFYIAENVIDEVIALGIPRDMIFIYEGIENGEHIFKQLDEFVFLPYLEFHTVDHCNLNCKGCAAFSPLCKEPVYVNVEEFKKDIKRLKELVPFIRTIQIMGGEPTLNPELGEFVKATRSAYPYSRLRLVTNGTKLNRLPDELWQIFVENEVVINLSCYPPIYDKMEEIISLIKLHEGMKEPMISQVSLFYPNLSTFKQYPFANTDYCRCYNLRDGKMSSCILSMYGHYFNDYFNGYLPVDSALIDIYEKNLTGKQLVNELNKPTDICNYCQNLSWRLNSKFLIGKTWDRYKKGESPQKSDWY